MGFHRAVFDAPPSLVFDALESIAQKNGFATERSGSGLTINAPLGQVVLGADGNRITADFSAPTLSELQLLKDRYADRFANLGFGKDIRWTAPGAQVPLNQTRCTIIDCRQISPNFTRLRLAGDFAAYARPLAPLHFRFLFGPEDAGLPYLDSNGLTAWPGGVDAWHRPPYTVRWLSENADLMDVDVVLHNGGRVTEWCAKAAVGDQIAINGPSGSKCPTAGWLALFGDETALPVIGRILALVPPETKGKAVVAVRDRGDAQDLSTDSQIDVEWIDMGQPDQMIRRVETLTPPSSDRYAFFAGERAQATEIRGLFKDAGLAGSEAKAASYWTRASDHE